jgi:hypothetical protein
MIDEGVPLFPGAILPEIAAFDRLTYRITQCRCGVMKLEFSAPSGHVQQDICT